MSLQCACFGRVPEPPRQAQDSPTEEQVGPGNPTPRTPPLLIGEEEGEEEWAATITARTYPIQVSSFPLLAMAAFVHFLWGLGNWFDGSHSHPPCVGLKQLVETAIHACHV